MLGDEAQPAENARRDKAASGPRHAAPRKSLLTKLHMPAGKAVALAAMPTAVLMGMGFTPHLAQADELPKSPYKPGPCVTQPDKPSPSATADPKAAKKDTKDAKDATSPDSGKDTSGNAAKAPTPTTSPSAKATEAPKAAASPSASAPAKQSEAAPTSSPSATPSPTKSVNPLDPLGLGDLLGGLLGSGSGTSDSGSTAAPTPTPSATTPAATSKPKPTTTTAPPSVSDTVKSTVETADGAVKGVEDTVKGVTDGVTDGASKATKTVKDVAGGKDPATDPQAFPCPTYDAKALADAKLEKGIPLLADEPWVLKSSLLTLYDLSYDGIVQVKTYNGTVKDVLKFTASGVDIGDLSQTVVGPNGTKTHVTARKDSTSTIRNSTVTMYTESISGNLLGVAPVTFTPKAPPPLTLPVTFFTDATVIQAAQFGGDLTVPGMRVLPNQPS